MLITLGSDQVKKIFKMRLNMRLRLKPHAIEFELLLHCSAKILKNVINTTCVENENQDLNLSQIYQCKSAMYEI